MKLCRTDPSSGSNRITLTGLCCALICVQPTVAQTTPAQALKYRNQRAPANPSKPLTASKYIPNVPPYAGKGSFQGGDQFDLAAGTSYVEHWLVAEDDHAVIDWYKGALGNFGWKVITLTPTCVKAEKDGSNVEVRSMSVATKPYKSQVTIQSYQRKP